MDDNANKKKHLRFFKPNQDEEENSDLDFEILDAILSDCNSTVDAIMHAVNWSEPSVIRHQLQTSRVSDSKGLVRAFQAALIVGTQDNKKGQNAEKVVKTLIDYNADAKDVDFDKLWQRDPYDAGKPLEGGGQEPPESRVQDKYGVIKKFVEHASASAAHRKRLTLTKKGTVTPGLSSFGDLGGGYELLQRGGFGVFADGNLGYQTNVVTRQKMFESKRVHLPKAVSMKFSSKCVVLIVARADDALIIG
jgi:hypothetical protein